MATAVIMPRQGQSVESCIITKWHKKEGEQVKTGDLLFTYETDKATFDEEAKQDGILLKILHQEDDDVPCLENVCIIGEKGEDISALLSNEKADLNTECENNNNVFAGSSADSTKNDVTTESITDKDGGFIKISPRARNLSQKLNIDYSLAVPTGAEGRIIERDIDELAKGGLMELREKSILPDNQFDQELNNKTKQSKGADETFKAAFVDEKISNMRKVIAKAMLHSLQSTAQLTHTASFDATEILEFRKKIKPLVEKGELNNITLNDIIMFTVSKVLLKHKLLNAHMLGDTMRFFNGVHLGMAVDTQRGLMVPVCFDADKKNLNQLAGELKVLAADAQKGTISPDLLSGGSFTVSNLGVFGTESFTPVLNAPQTGILGVNTIVTRVREVNGQIKAYPSMSLSLTYDHRALDGVAAAKFLQAVCSSLENFTVALATL